MALYNTSEKYINNSRHLARKYCRIFVRGHYLFQEMSYKVQIMSKEAIVFIILQIFLQCAQF